MNLKPRLCLLVLMLAVHTSGGNAQGWAPVVDEVYLQEVGTQVKTEEAVHSPVFHQDGFYTLSKGELHALEGDRLTAKKTFESPARDLKVLEGSLWVSTERSLHRWNGSGWFEVKPESRVWDLCSHLGQVWVGTDAGIFRVEVDRLEQVYGGGRWRGGFQAMASFNESLYLLAPGRLLLFDGKQFEYENVIEWGEFPTRETRDLFAYGPTLNIATDRGVGQLRGTALTLLQGGDGLPCEDVTCFAAGFDGDLWIGTNEGAIRRTREGDFHYFAGPRWLPSDRVTGIACSSDLVVIATEGGVGVLRYEPFTLQKKAEYYDRWLEEWGQKRLGFVHKLEWKADRNEWVREVSDNDAGWSTHYLAAMCFKYAVTGDPRARAEAVDYFDALKWCEEITPMDGFPARSIWAVGEKGHQAEGGSGGYAAEWHRTPDNLWEWKGDTSSDETDAHYYATSIFHDLVAEGAEKERAREHLERISDHIIANAWTLRDVDGRPTVWARWDPEYFSSPRGYYARGLNGLEILSYIRTTMEISGEPRFATAYQQLQGYGYHNEVVRQKLTFPPGDIFHSDDRLAFYAYYPLLKYEKDPHLRSIYRRSFERSWEIERIERNPWFNFIYGALTGNDCEAEEAVEHLRDWPLDLVNHSFRNSHRADIHTPAGYVPYADGVRYFSPRERGPHRWTDCTLDADGGGGGMEVVDPSGWIEAYWMGRYYGIIAAPTTDDPALLTVEKRGVRLGAAPYAGPPRPGRP